MLEVVVVKRAWPIKVGMARRRLVRKSHHERWQVNCPAPNTRASGRCFCYWQIPNAAARSLTKRVTLRDHALVRPPNKGSGSIGVPRLAIRERLEPAIAPVPE